MDCESRQEAIRIGVCNPRSIHAAILIHQRHALADLTCNRLEHATCEKFSVRTCSQRQHGLGVAGDGRIEIQIKAAVGVEASQAATVVPGDCLKLSAHHDLAIALYQQRQHGVVLLCANLRIECRIKATVRSQAGKIIPAHATDLGEMPCNQQLLVRERNNDADPVVGARCKARIKAAVRMQPRKSGTRHAIDGVEFPADQYLAIALNGQRFDP